MSPEIREQRKVLIRDLAIFLLKTAIDGLKGFVVMQVAVVAAGLDIVIPGKRPGHRFYTVLGLAERFDLWLNLYKPSSQAEENEDGLFGASSASADTLLGKLETVVRGGDAKRTSNVL